MIVKHLKTINFLYLVTSVVQLSTENVRRSMSIDDKILSFDHSLKTIKLFT